MTGACLSKIDSLSLRADAVTLPYLCALILQ